MASRKFCCGLCLLLMLILSSNYVSGCVIGNFNLTRLSTFNPWLVADDNGDMLYEIHLCGAPPSSTAVACTSGITVTGKNNTNARTTTYGDCRNHNFTEEEHQSELLAVINGDPCPITAGVTTATIIYFKCGKTLGAPVYLEYFGCTAYFEWESTVFCKDMDSAVTEIPCSIVNGSKMIDLSPLSKQRSGYLVDSQNGRKFYINVCRGITPDADSGTGACPKGSASCRVIDNVGVDMGRPTTRLQVTDGGDIQMVYTTTQKPAGCVETPTTTVTFRCPKKGGSRAPMLIGNFLCNVEIEWFTEYACPQQTIINTNTSPCRLTMETHNIDVDLSPLASSSPYKVLGQSGRDSYEYFIGVCGGAGSACETDGSGFVAACQKKPNDDFFNKQLGKTDHATLRYSDGELLLIYKDGDACKTSFRRQTVIAFQCQRDAENSGIGKPAFREDNNCTYFFDWHTAYACVSRTVETSCSLDHEGHRFDLSDLTVENGSNWVAVSDWGGKNEDQYFVNVCHDILQEGPAQNCPPGAAICEIKSHSDSFNLGSYTTGPTYDNNTGRIYINYTATNGSHTSPRCPTVSSTIDFTCKPGDSESGPRLVLKSEDHCFHRFEWHTAAACPLSHQQGADCRVFDTQAGYSFDLSVLSRPEGYKVSAGEFDYYINVCGKLTGAHCQSAPHDNAGVCQVKAGSPSDEVKTGEPNGNLTYYDGVLNLTYTNGEPYNDEKRTPRTTEVAFICDPSAGTGTPQFVHEQAHTYNFKWLTAYACPTQPIECVAVGDDGTEYDLSSLSKSLAGENWVVLDDSDPSSRRKFYINVCRPLTSIPDLTSGGCDTLAAACETSLSGDKEMASIRNLGHVKSGPTVEKGLSGYIRLVYADGDPCPAGGAGARYNTSVHFMCHRGQQARGPTPPRKVGPCSYEVLWETVAACAVTDETVPETGEDTWQRCSLKDPDSQFTYNLQSLRKTGNGEDYYTVQTVDKRHTFRLNICGPVTSCGLLNNLSSSVCEVQSVHNVPLVYLNDMAAVLQGGSVMITYIGHEDEQGHRPTVKIELSCDRDADGSEMPVFVRQEGKEYVFQLSTPVVCPPQPVDCVVQDSAGRQYDLTPLAKVTGNWDVNDLRGTHSDLRYHINVCRPINQGANLTCPGGPIGGCQTGGGQAFSLGYIQSKPQVAEDGTVSLRYVGGTLCHQGKPSQAHRSMRINFYCAAQESEPVFDGESDTCEYSFTWRTPSACPQQLAVGSECKVSDPVYSYQFDLTSLRKTNADYEVAGGGYTFLLNVCGELHTSLAECQGMAACQTGPTLTSPVPVGKPNSTLVYDAGELSLVYDEGQNNCHGKYTRQTVLTFRCSQDNPNQGPHYLMEQSDCTYTFDWPTPLACPPHTVVDCTYTDSEGNLYDLSSLSLTDSNYVEMGTDGTKIILNVCRSLVQRKGETCPFDSASCLINMTATDPQKKYMSLGQVSSNPVRMEEGKLVIRYNTGAPCSYGGIMSTFIVFSCPTSQQPAQEGGPHHFVKNKCEHGFAWETPVACPVTHQSAGNDCNVTNSATGYEFSLKSLNKPEGWEVNDRDGHNFKINVCGPVTGNTCAQNSGSCQSEVNGEGRAFSAGVANAQLEYQRDGVLRLNYSGGDVCRHNVPRTTFISFICQQDAGQGRPVFVASSDGCLYYFDWHTSLACEQQVTCEVAGENGMLDLTPLIKLSGHHLALPDETRPPHGSNVTTAGTYYINVCHPLNPVLGTLCPPGAAACRVLQGKPPQGLGQARSPPVYYADRKEVVLNYDSGWPCEWNRAINTSSRIIFRCKPGPTQGIPLLVDVSDSCEYIFEWETNVICPDDVVEAETANCSFYDARTKVTYDLSVLNDKFEVNSYQGGKFSVQACGALSTSSQATCQGAAVCLQGSLGIPDGSYGKASTGSFEMQDEMLKLTFTGGQNCSGVGASMVILFECDYSAGKGQPVLWPHMACEVTFKWRTSVVCPPLVQDCAVTYGDATFDLTILSQSRDSWEHNTTDGSTYWLNLCQAVHGSAFTSQCPPQAAVCRRTKDGRVDMLGDVQSQHMYTQRAADGNVTVVVEYSQGSTACSSNHRRSNNQVARSVIRLTCGNTVGRPQLINGQENAAQCLFEFEWKTRMVCLKDNMPVELTDVNHVIQDAPSGVSIDLHPLLKSEHMAQAGPYYYAINLDGRMSTGGGACAGATICQVQHNDSSIQHAVGTFASRKYYLQEDKLEVVYTSPEKCSGRFKDKNTTSIISFSCSEDATQQTEPSFLYNTLDCVYLFSWDTPAVCIHLKLEVQTAGSVHGSGGAVVNSGDKSSIKTSTLGAIVGTFLAVVIVCILAVVFHKPERRVAAARGFRRWVLCRRTVESQMKYSVLSQMDEDPEVDLPVECNPFEADALEERELRNGDPVMVRGYHDDSDDDMLL